MKAYVKQYGNDVIRHINGCKETAYKHYANAALDKLIAICDNEIHGIRRTIEITERGYITTFEAMRVICSKQKHFSVVWNTTVDDENFVIARN